MKIIDKVIKENKDIISKIGLIGCPSWFGYKEKCKFNGLSKSCEECWNSEVGE